MNLIPTGILTKIDRTTLFLLTLKPWISGQRSLLYRVLDAVWTELELRN